MSDGTMCHRIKRSYALRLSMIEPSNTELLATDIDELYVNLNNSRRNPKLFRQYFEQYLIKSQQATDVMRKEFKQITGQKWEAKSFDGWSSYTQTLKSLRNASVHGSPIVFYEVTISIYPLIEFSSDKAPIKDSDINRGFRATKSTLLIENPLADIFIPSGTGFLRKNKIFEDLQDPRNYIFPIKSFASYEIKWSILDEVSKPIETIDVVKILLKTYPILQRYFKYYKNELLAYVKK